MARAGRRHSAETAEWLRNNPSLEELTEAYPDVWVQAQRDVDEVLSRDDAKEIRAYISQAARPEAALPGRARSLADRLHHEIRRQMTVHLLKQAILSASTGVQEGRVRFNLVAGSVAQRLLFRRGLERKPVPLGAFRAVWPLLRGQRRLLMPLVQPRGIWCFYSRPLITRLAALIGDRSCLEIAAGDGTLSRFLSDAGVRIVATDDHSWSDSITFPESVLCEDARTALRRHRPQVVICSWPPSGNRFEQHVFTTAEVEQYIMIGSRHEAATGNWQAYREQTGFAYAEDRALSRLVLPPEVDHAVFVFTRNGSTAVQPPCS